jgi:hypothetical protein
MHLVDSQMNKVYWKLCVHTLCPWVLILKRSGCIHLSGEFCKAFRIRISWLLNHRALFKKKITIQHKATSAKNNLPAAIGIDVYMHWLQIDRQTTAYRMSYIEKCGSAVLGSLFLLFITQHCFVMKLISYYLINVESPCCETGISTKGIWTVCYITEFWNLL